MSAAFTGYAFTTDRVYQLWDTAAGVLVEDRSWSTQEEAEAFRARLSPELQARLKILPTAAYRLGEWQDGTRLDA